MILKLLLGHTVECVVCGEQLRYLYHLCGQICPSICAGVKLNIGGSVHDPTDPIGRLLFTTLAMIAEFEADLARARTREGMAVARAKGRLRGKQPKLTPRQEAHLAPLLRDGAGSGSVQIRLQKALLSLARLPGGRFREPSARYSAMALRLAEKEIVWEEDLAAIRGIAEQVEREARAA